MVMAWPGAGLRSVSSAASRAASAACQYPARKTKPGPPNQAPRVSSPARPSWSLIGAADHVIPSAEQVFMSQRAKAYITEINAGHLSLISHPGAVTRIIIQAERVTS